MNNTPCGRGFNRHRSVLCIGFSALAFQTNAESPSVTKDPTTYLPDINVTARRLEEHPLDVPAYTQVLSRDVIERSGASNLIELLKSEANLTFSSFSSSPTDTAISLRGTGNDSGNGRTLIVINGIRMNRPDMGQFNWLQFPIQDIENIEILQGPQGGYYGDNALGGVIKINTRGIPENNGGRVNVMAGSYGTLKASGDYAHAWGNLWASLSGGHEQSDGYRVHSKYNSSSGALNFGYDNNKNSATQIGVSYLDCRFQQPNSLTLSQFNTNPRQDGGSFAEGWNKTWRFTANNRLGGKDESQITTDFGYSQAEEFSKATWGTRYNRRIDGGSLSPKGVYKTDKGTVRLGLDLNADRLDVVSSQPAQGKLERLGISPYLGGELLLHEKVSLSGVFRREFNEISAESSVPKQQHSRRSDEGDAYQLAVNVRPTNATRIYAKYDHAYHFPATDQIAYYQGFASPLFFNQNLKAERSGNYEVGGDYKKGSWQGGVAAYVMKTVDEISFNNLTNLNENIAKTRRTGAQTHLRYDNGTYGFRLRADYVDAKVTDDPANHTDGRIPLTPAWQTSETLFYRPVTDCTVSVGHRYKGTSGSSPAGSGSIPCVNFVDVKVTYDITAAWSAYAGVNNIADRKSISSNVWGAIYPDEGRFMFLGSTYKF
ncbi:MAG: TonB-dependent receptor [Verrucomicrobiota bacterium]